MKTKENGNKKNRKKSTVKSGVKRKKPSKKTTKKTAPVENGAENQENPPENEPEYVPEVPEEVKYRKLLSALIPKRARFVEEYLIDLNATKAAERSGYSAHTAMTQAARLCRDVKVRAAIEAGKAAKSRELNISANTVIRELALLGFSDLSDYVKWDHKGRPVFKTSGELGEKSKVVESIKFEPTITGHKITLKLHDKTKSLELLARHLGILNDKMAISDPGGEAVPFTNLEKAARLVYLIEKAKNAVVDK